MAADGAAACPCAGKARPPALLEKVDTRLCARNGTGLSQSEPEASFFAGKRRSFAGAASCGSEYCAGWGTTGRRFFIGPIGGGIPTGERRTGLRVGQWHRKRDGNRHRNLPREEGTDCPSSAIGGLIRAA